MAWTIINQGSNTSISPGFSVSVAPGDCTGADLLMAIVTGYGAAASVVGGDLTDDSSNSWTKQVLQTAGGDTEQWAAGFYVFNPVVDSAMTFTFQRGVSATFPTLVIYAFSGLHASPSVTSASSGTLGGGGTSIQAGSLGSADDLVVEGFGWYPTISDLVIDGSFASPLIRHYSAGNNIGGAASYKSVSGAENPTWSWSGTATAGAAVAMAFPGTGGGGADGQPTIKRWGGNPFMGTQKLRNGGRGGPWAKSDAGIYLRRAA